MAPGPFALAPADAAGGVQVDLEARRRPGCGVVMRRQGLEEPGRGQIGGLQQAGRAARYGLQAQPAPQDAVGVDHAIEPARARGGEGHVHRDIQPFAVHRPVRRMQRPPGSLARLQHHWRRALLQAAVGRQIGRGLFAQDGLEPAVAEQRTAGRMHLHRLQSAHVQNHGLGRIHMEGGAHARAGDHNLGLSVQHLQAHGVGELVHQPGEHPGVADVAAGRHHDPKAALAGGGHQFGAAHVPRLARDPGLCGRVAGGSHRQPVAGGLVDQPRQGGVGEQPGLVQTMMEFQDLAPRAAALGGGEVG